MTDPEFEAAKEVISQRYPLLMELNKPLPWPDQAFANLNGLTDILVELGVPRAEGLRVEGVPMREDAEEFKVFLESVVPLRDIWFGAAFRFAGSQFTYETMGGRDDDGDSVFNIFCRELGVPVWPREGDGDYQLIPEGEDPGKCVGDAITRFGFWVGQTSLDAWDQEVLQASKQYRVQLGMKSLAESTGLLDAKTPLERDVAMQMMINEAPEQVGVEPVFVKVTKVPPPRELPERFATDLDPGIQLGIPHAFTVDGYHHTFLIVSLYRPDLPGRPKEVVIEAESGVMLFGKDGDLEGCDLAVAMAMWLLEEVGSDEALTEGIAQATQEDLEL